MSTPPKTANTGTFASNPVTSTVVFVILDPAAFSSTDGNGTAGWPGGQDSDESGQKGSYKVTPRPAGRHQPTHAIPGWPTDQQQGTLASRTQSQTTRNDAVHIINYTLHIITVELGVFSA